MGGGSQGTSSGERRELFRAETDVWTLFRKILSERKRRELDPSLSVLDRAFQAALDDPSLQELKSRIEPLRRFFPVDRIGGGALLVVAGGRSCRIQPDCSRR